MNATNLLAPKRNSTIELLRIVCMLLIIFGHTIQEHHDVFSLVSPEEIVKLFGLSACCVAVNAFVIITGWFGIKFRWERLLRLDVQAVFYSVGLLGVAVALGWHQISVRTDIFYLFPLLTKRYWFITCYAVLYLIAPWLNQWRESMSKQQFRRVLVGGFLLIYVWPTVSFLFNAPQFINDSGYGIVNFCYLYLLGYYLRHHYVPKGKSGFYWGGYFLISLALFVCQYTLSRVLGFEFTSWISYNTVFVLLGAVCLFLAFERMSFSSSVVNYLAKPCLAVYLIHMHPCVWGTFCETIGVAEYHGWRYVALLILLPVAVYLSCSMIEIARMRLFGRYA